jgi:hypothetical protein
VKIFVGGLRKHHQENLERRYPTVDFSFASFDDSWDRWREKARHVDVVIIDQSRCNHTITDHMKKYIRVPVHFTDRKPRIRELIEELMAHGTTDHSYV